MRGVGVLLEEIAGVFASLTDALAVEAEPGAGFFDHVVNHAEIEKIALAGGAFAVEDVKLGFAER